MHQRTTHGKASTFTAAFALTVSLFALWGVGHRLYETLLPQFAQVFGLHGFELTLTQGMFEIVYFVGAIPAALYARRFGFKAGVIFGLGAFSLGAFVLYPAAGTHAFAYFLFAVTVMAIGLIWLEMAANPLAVSFGSDETGVQRLNLAQSFYPLGALLGIYAGRWIVNFHLALTHQASAYAVAHPYIVLGAVLLLLTFLFDDARFPAAATQTTQGIGGVAGEFRALLSRPFFVLGMAAQFFAVVALLGVWTASGHFFDAAFPGMSNATAADAVAWALITFAAGRFVGTALMTWIPPDRLLAAFAGAGLLLAAIPAFTGEPVGTVSMIAGSFFVSIMWPTILGLAIRGSGPLMKLGTALICMSGAVGGLANRVLNTMLAIPSVHVAMLVPVVSHAVVLAFAIASWRAGRRA